MKQRLVTRDGLLAAIDYLVVDFLSVAVGIMMGMVLGAAALSVFVGAAAEQIPDGFLAFCAAISMLAGFACIFLDVLLEAIGVPFLMFLGRRSGRFRNWCFRQRMIRRSLKTRDPLWQLLYKEHPETWY